MYGWSFQSIFQATLAYSCVNIYKLFRQIRLVENSSIGCKILTETSTFEGMMSSSEMEFKCFTTENVDAAEMTTWNEKTRRLREIVSGVY